MHIVIKETGSNFKLFKVINLRYLLSNLQGKYSFKSDSMT